MTVPNEEKQQKAPLILVHSNMAGPSVQV